MTATSLKFGSYPYIATRVKAMKSRLLGKEDYIKLRKMQLNEIIRFLQEGEYKREIEELAERYAGVELINLSLNSNLANAVNRLISMSSKEVKSLLKLYAGKWATNNIKIVLRTRLNRLTKEDMVYAIMPVQPTDYEFCSRLLEEENPFPSMGKVTGIPEGRLRELFQEGRLAEMENELDMAHYRCLLTLTNAVVMSSRLLKDFLKSLVILLNIRNVIKFKLEGMKREEVQKYVIGASAEVARIAEAEGVKGAIETLKGGRYRLIAEGVEKDMTQLEGNMEKFFLEFSSRLMHMQPLSILPIFGYLLGKEAETRNLRLLAYAKHTGMQEAFIEANTVMPAA